MEEFEESTERKAFAWEGEYDRPWEALEETTGGRLALREDDMGFSTKRRRFIGVDQGTVKRRMLRAVLLVVDASKASAVPDFKPTRLIAVTNALSHFARAFFDENPLSSMGVICTRKGKVERLCEFSKSPRSIEDALLSLQTTSASEGCATLQNALEWASAMFKYIPDYIEREVLIVASALSVVDPGDVFSTIKTLREKPSVRCSTIHVCALVEIYKRLAEQTSGSFSVAANPKHLQDLLAEHVTPPPSTAKDCHMVQMGFPSQKLDSLNSGAQPAYCIDTGKIQRAPYYCPRCRGAASYLPTTCRTCQLSLISSSHLARSHHHLFPVDVFVEIPNVTEDTICSSCRKGRPAHLSTSAAFYSSCPKCHWTFCRYCDDMIHDTLFVCPGCIQ